jgi:hypothetical protein
MGLYSRIDRAISANAKYQELMATKREPSCGTNPARSLKLFVPAVSGAGGYSNGNKKKPGAGQAPG